MPHSSFMAAEELCTKVAEQFTAHVNCNNPTVMGYTDGALEFALSRENESCNTINISAPVGGVRKREVWFRPRLLAGDAVTDPSAVCATPGGTPPRSSFDVSMANWVGSEKLKISFSDLQQYCEGPAGPQTFINSWILPLLTQARHKLNQLVLTDINANAGVNNYNLVTGVPVATPKDIDVLDPDGNALAFGIATLLEDYSNHQLTGTPGLIGMGNMAMYARMKDIACCNNGGSDASRLNNGFAWHKDLSANSILGENNVALIAPGAMKLITWAENQGAYASTGQMFTQITLPDPTLNMVWDFEAYVTACAKYVEFFVGVHWDTVFWPADIFQSGDELENVNGIFLYAANQQA